MQLIHRTRMCDKIQQAIRIESDLGARYSFKKSEV
jgi:hypothetical protein